VDEYAYEMADRYGIPWRRSRGAFTWVSDLVWTVRKRSRDLTQAIAMVNAAFGPMRGVEAPPYCDHLSGVNCCGVCECLTNVGAGSSERADPGQVDAGVAPCIAPAPNADSGPS
jgi:hypothetical protein